MDTYGGIVWFLEIVGTVAFASSGAMVGIRKNMDIFGVNVLGLVTALGGGLIRDLILGITPPNMFRDPSYALTAVVTSCVLFIVIYFRKNLLNSRHMRRYEQVMVVMDTIGLSTFTVIGIDVAVGASFGDSRFLLVFLGAITGVGGGMIRDVLAGETPYVLVRHVYACASLAGAILCVALRRPLGNGTAMLAGAFLTGVVRWLAVKKNWNLPKIYK
ncbi:MAG: trimeric intracellular cation channel family protein [Fusobacteriaceae bacterium]|jgi:uncharacterized membrane protein YeiH|nr:trimeric intracellular cation channel family protein [Fusobacteriaceae bacterium]